MIHLPLIFNLSDEAVTMDVSFTALPPENFNSYCEEYNYTTPFQYNYNNRFSDEPYRFIGEFNSTDWTITTFD